MKRYAVIPTRDRPEDYARAVTAIRCQIDDLITVAHHRARYALGNVIGYDEEPPNISRMWNLGLDRAAELAGSEPHLVAILNDDAEVPWNWFGTVERAMAEEQTVLGSGRNSTYRTRRMICGYAFVLRGGTLRPSENWEWWCSDDYLALAAERLWGGRTYLSDLRVPHRHRELPEGEMSQRAHQAKERWLRMSDEERLRG